MEILESLSPRNCTKPSCQLTSEQVKEEMHFFQKVFTVVRLLKGDSLDYTSANRHEVQFCQCYDFWENGRPCENCISAQTLKDKQQHTKLEFLETDIYQVFPGMWRWMALRALWNASRSWIMILWWMHMARKS